MVMPFCAAASISNAMASPIQARTGIITISRAINNIRMGIDDTDQAKKFIDLA